MSSMYENAVNTDIADLENQLKGLFVSVKKTTETMKDQYMFEDCDIETIETEMTYLIGNIKDSIKTRLVKHNDQFDILTECINSTEDMDYDHLKKCTKRQLQIICMNKGLNKYANKDILINRILFGEEDEENEEDEKIKPLSRSSLMQKKKEVLQQLCDEEDIMYENKSTKKELVDMLLSDGKDTSGDDTDVNGSDDENDTDVNGSDNESNQTDDDKVDDKVDEDNNINDNESNDEESNPNEDTYKSGDASNDITDDEVNKNDNSDQPPPITAKILMREKKTELQNRCVVRGLEFDDNKTKKQLVGLLGY